MPVDMSVELLSCPGELDMLEEQLFACERSSEIKVDGAEELTGNADDGCDDKVTYLTGLLPSWYERPSFTVPATAVAVALIFLKVK